VVKGVEVDKVIDGTSLSIFDHLDDLDILDHLFRNRRQPRIEPRPPPANQRARVGPAGYSQLARHTGARRFIGSGTVDHQ
jgi:hypothetical protein